MTSMINHHTNGQIPSIFSQPLAFAGRIARRIRERREMNRLLSFPDHLLNDIGLQRNDMQRKALDPLWRD